jgi:glutamate-1-semialdehyde 2,1-aminomutase
LATAAGLATLELLDAPAYGRLEAVAATLADGLRGAAADAGVPVHVCHTTGLLTVFFSDGPVGSYEDAKNCDTERFGAFARGMLERGVYLPPSQFEAWFVSLAHSDGQVERTLAAAREAMAAL